MILASTMLFIYKEAMYRISSQIKHGMSQTKMTTISFTLLDNIYICPNKLSKKQYIQLHEN